MSLKKIIDCIRKHKSFLITAHQNLEGDALGSEIAMHNLLKKLGKRSTIVNHDPVPATYAFLKGTQAIKKYRPNLKVNFDVFIALDCSDACRCGSVFELADSSKFVINIDHHISNTRFGQVNWIEPAASSVAEMIFLLYEKMQVSINQDAASALYAGILTDTGSFHYPNTTASTHRAAAELLKAGVDSFAIYRNIYESFSFSDMENLAKILSKMQKYSGERIIVFQIERKLLRAKELNMDLSENILSFGRAIRNCEVCVLFKEQLNRVRVNFRSPGKIDVNRIARFFGGGGHHTSSGCTIKGSLKQVKPKVINKIKEHLD